MESDSTNSHKHGKHHHRRSSVTAGPVLAAALLMGFGAAPAQAQPAATSQVLDGQRALDVQQRIDGVRADLARAVASGSVTREQADAFFEKIVRGILAD